MGDEKKHILIISGPMGNGHIQAAAGIEAWAKKDFPNYRITNINIGDVMWKPCTFFYAQFYKFLITYYPRGWEDIYSRNDKPDTFMSRIGAKLRKMTAKPLLKEIKKLKPDYIISTHFLPPEILNEEKKRGRITVPVASVVTDFSLNRIYVQPYMDFFFVASEELKFRLHKEGIPEEKIFVSGIPVKPEFDRVPTPEEKAKIKEEMGIAKDTPVVLLMMGGDSKGALREISDLLLKTFPKPAIIVLPGKNAAALAELEKLKESYPGRLFPIGFTREVWKYMAASTVVVSKPGGISTSECLAMKLPMVIMYPIPGQEERNADYLMDTGVATKAYDETALLYKRVFFTPDKVEYMRKCIDQVRKPRAGHEILKTVIGE